MDLAMKVGAPVVGLNDSGGARIQEGVASLGGYAEIFLRNVLASGVVPQISVILGPCAGGAVYSPAMTDFTVMVEGTSYMFVTGPNVVKAVTHEEIDAESLGGAWRPHRAQRRRASRGPRRGRGDGRTCGALLAHLPQNNLADAPVVAARDPADRMDAELDAVVPDEPLEAVRHARRPAPRRRRRRVPRDPAGVGRQHPRRVRAARRAAGRRSSRSSPRCSPARSTSTRR